VGFDAVMLFGVMPSLAWFLWCSGLFSSTGEIPCVTVIVQRVTEDIAVKRKPSNFLGGFV